ncbi:MAG: hypothetical protein EXQ94_02025 [Alphaproteobacteria bacterium]|nr:hypothetical protein [Alphaproteobacteria bacterium]
MMKRTPGKTKWKADTHAPTETRSVTPIMDRIAGMSNVELNNLRDNAERMAVSGSAKQVVAAVEVLPVVANELAARKAQHKAALAVARAERKEAAVRTGPPQS